MKKNLGSIYWEEREIREGDDLACPAPQWCLVKQPHNSMLTGFSQLVAGGDFSKQIVITDDPITIKTW